MPHTLEHHAIRRRLTQAGIDNVNIFKIERYMQRSKLATKVRTRMGWQNDAGLLERAVLRFWDSLNGRSVRRALTSTK